MKATESKQRFCLMTGSLKFAMASISSGLNNLTDITMDTRFSALLGYTHEEVKANFPGRLTELADRMGTDIDSAFMRHADMYGGYCFDRSMTRVFNPASLAHCLDALTPRSYWFETGAPSWLMSYTKKKPMDMGDIWVGESDLGTIEPASPSLPAALLQTGYLTIKGILGQGLATLYNLGFPNKEAARAFDCLTHNVGAWVSEGL